MDGCTCGRGGGGGGGINTLAADAALLRPISGRYRGHAPGLEVELRVDVDGPRSLARVSGDLFKISGATTRYLGTFVVAAPSLAEAGGQLTIEGAGNYSFQSGQAVVKVSVQRVPASQPPPPAVVHFELLQGTAGVQVGCNFESVFFRRVELERDVVAGVTPFSSYDTARLKSGGVDRLLTVESAYAEAGIEIELVNTGGTDTVAVIEAGGDAVWNNRELHASMVRHFVSFENEPGWRVWLLSATAHVSDFRGVMFDNGTFSEPSLNFQDTGRHRQGCAVFHQKLGTGTAENERAQLRTYVHELGHCFNLFHSNQKSSMKPPQANRPGALSWMNEPDSFQSPAGSGAAAFWKAFPFEFDRPELEHLRHGFRNDVIMGGSDFGAGAADTDPLDFADPVEDRTGLELRLRAATSYYLGEPVVLELRLGLASAGRRLVNARLHPNDGFVQLAIRRPGGQLSIYRPFVRAFATPQPQLLDAATPAIYDSAYVGYGRDGLYFEQPGTYQVRAVYEGLDGSRVVSNVVRLRVASPVDRQEDDLADLLLGDQQGRLFYLLGSRCGALEGGNRAFENLLERQGEHPLAVYPRLVFGMCAAQEFKVVDSRRRRVSCQPPDYGGAIAWLAAAVRTTTLGNPQARPMADVGLDNITLGVAFRCLAATQRVAGEAGAARATVEAMNAHFTQPHIPAFVRQRLAAGAEPVAAAAAKGGDDEKRPPRPRKRRASK
jgi:hypothetical protein